MDKIAVLSAGWGGLSIFSHLIKRGYDVNLWNHDPQSLKPIIKREMIHVIDSEGEFVVNIDSRKNVVSTDIERVIKDAEMIVVPLPLQYQAFVARLCAPHLEDGQAILLIPGSAGSLEMAKTFREINMDKEILLAEGATLPMSGRRIEPGVIRTRYPHIRSGKKPERRQMFSSFPAKKVREAKKKFEEIYNFTTAKNVLEVGMLNVNFLIHPAPFIMNLGVIENTRGDFSLLNEGISPSTLRVMDALDAEKLDLCRALRIAALSVADCYGLREGRLPAYLRKVPGPLGFRDRIPNVENCRYLVEDTCGLVMWSSIGDLIDVETQITDSIIRLANITQGVNFWAFGRTVDKMGLSGMGVDDIEKYLYEGSLPQ